MFYKIFCVFLFQHRRAWKRWQDQKENAEAMRNNDTLALQFWSYRVQAQVILVKLFF